MDESTGAVVEHAHPGASTYVKIAVILSIITITEVAIYYIHAVRPVLIPALIALSITKFALVVGYYMHLKFDARLLSGVFLWGLFVALSIGVSLEVLFSAF
ncbi:MAG: cytochrome C oxidase subunit IV family protein [Thermomicrobiaceae bacterium]|nr:cytochrome C oxidase subunit IV family protein [Thermomicrobiaceae bacterium]